MFKRLFFLSGFIAFLLACAMMYFWYLPNHSAETPETPERRTEVDVIELEVDSLNISNPEE